MFIANHTRFPNAVYCNPHSWNAHLDGVPVTALAADDERGFVDVVVDLDKFETLYRCICSGCGDMLCEACYYNQEAYQEWIAEGHNPTVTHRLWGRVSILVFT